jgi:hypothetical protein
MSRESLIGYFSKVWFGSIWKMRCLEDNSNKPKQVENYNYLTTHHCLSLAFSPNPNPLSL